MDDIKKILPGLIVELRDSCDVVQNGLFKDYERLDRACVAYLKTKGYRVISPEYYMEKFPSAKNSTKLIDYFYGMMAKHHPLLGVHKNLDRDRAIAKRFVEARMVATGMPKTNALRECAEIISVVVLNLHDFNLEGYIGFSIFGQDAFGWVTEKALRMINKERIKIRDAQVDSAIEQALEKIPQSEHGWSQEKIELALKKLEEDNG